MAMATAMERFRNRKGRIFVSFLQTEGTVARASSIAQRAAVLARIGTAGERSLVPVDPDRLSAAERTDDAHGPMPQLLQALDGIGGHPIFELVDVFVVQPTWHIDRLLHVATVIE